MGKKNEKLIQALLSSDCSDDFDIALTIIDPQDTSYIREFVLSLVKQNGRDWDEGKFMMKIKNMKPFSRWKIYYITFRRMREEIYGKS